LEVDESPLATKLGINYDTLICRIKRYGWSDVDAVRKAVRGDDSMRKYQNS